MEGLRYFLEGRLGLDVHGDFDSDMKITVGDIFVESHLPLLRGKRYIFMLDWQVWSVRMVGDTCLEHNTNPGHEITTFVGTVQAKHLTDWTDDTMRAVSAEVDNQDIIYLDEIFFSN